jgi:hypothetical protein
MTIDELMSSGSQVKQKFGITKKDVGAKIYHEFPSGKN